MRNRREDLLLPAHYPGSFKKGIVLAVVRKRIEDALVTLHEDEAVVLSDIGNDQKNEIIGPFFFELGHLLFEVRPTLREGLEAEFFDLGNADVVAFLMELLAVG